MYDTVYDVILSLYLYFYVRRQNLLPRLQEDNAYHRGMIKIFCLFYNFQVDSSVLLFGTNSCTKFDEILLN